MLAQGVLPFEFLPETGKTNLTAYAGLPVYLDLAAAIGLRESIEQHLAKGESGQGWSDAQVVISLVLLNLAGGDSVDDLRILEGDSGFGRVLRRTEMSGMSRRERRAAERRFRKGRQRSVPSPSAARRSLLRFVNRESEAERGPGRAYIPSPSARLTGLRRVNADLLAFYQKRRLQKHATLDMDATLVETTKEDALFGYKKFKAFQPLNTYWFEQGTVVHSEFRDGNVNAGYDQLRILKESLAMLPAGVETVSMRSDTAGHQWDLIRYCVEGKNERFGVIDFAIGAKVTTELKNAIREVDEADWKPIPRIKNGECEDTEQQWAEVWFESNASSHKKGGARLRFIATREPVKQLEIAGMESQQTLPFPTVDMDAGAETIQYKVHALVTNRLEMPGELVIQWIRGRCGRSEGEHAVMKDDLAGGTLPSQHFGVNAAWWAIMILALNLNVIMKTLVLGPGWERKRMKAVRFGFINAAARVQERGRRLRLRIQRDNPVSDLLIAARERILELALPPPDLAV